MEATLKISKETMRKNKRSNRELRKLRLKRLKELESDGKLSSATCRKDISKMLGYSGGYDAGYTWISKIIKDGVLQETLVGFDSKSKPEYEYHMKATKPQATTIHEPQPITEPVIISRASTPANNNLSRVVIKYKELVIEVEQVNYNFIADIVSKLADK